MRRRTGFELALGAVALLALVVGVGSWLRDRRIIRMLFGDWTTEQVSRLSDSVYHLSFTRPRLHWGRRRVHVDSIALTTDSTRLLQVGGDRPQLHLIFRDCQLSGVQLIPLALGHGLNARDFGCTAADLAVDFPAKHATPPSEPKDTLSPERAFMVLTRDIELPHSVPAIRIAGITFTQTKLALAQRRFSGARANLSLVLDWRLRAVNLDPRDPVAMRRPLFSEAVNLDADSVHYSTKPGLETRVGHIAIGVTDSTMELRDFFYGPEDDDKHSADHLHASDRIRSWARRVAYQGLDLTQLAEGNGLSMRKLEVDSASLDMLSDKRQPETSQRETRLTPQQWIAELDRGVAIDSVIVTRGSVTYRELHPKDRTPGILKFDDIKAVATNMRHMPGRPNRSQSMRLELTSRFMEQAPLQASFDVPLDAPTFTMSFRGRAGTMDVTQLNDFMGGATPVQIKEGRVDSLRFDIAVRSGVARGKVVPFYGNLALDITGQGMGGVLGGKGIISDVARGMAEFAVNKFKLRRSNPEEGKPPREGRVEHPFSSDETLPAFLWNGIREGLVDVIKGNGEQNKSPT